MANIMPAYFEYAAARLSGGHLPEWRTELLDVLRMVLRRECGTVRMEDLGARGEVRGSDNVGEGIEEEYRKTMRAWNAVVDVERFAQGYDDDCAWTFETGSQGPQDPTGSSVF
ncbi:hypothetical protein NM688_g9121 [Phlebia brevispora]|uniref:Uncharacterized protein n=1 Tax=Phlebia brevispora TaxID=194682 RepID=A0ACC1RJ64_9APHY|nr:hypothetical protein NM688_g9121 [Phlebia brevispora]